jgi:fermentation-respiration switch protein FrsA (DUF1100 family)
MNRFIFVLAIILIVMTVSYLYANWVKYVALFVPVTKFKDKTLISKHNSKHYSDFYVKTDDGSLLHGWFYQCPKNQTGETVFLCHGNTGNISYRDFMIEICSTFKLNAVLFDYRGYGKSTGFPSQDKLYDDGQIIYDWMINEIKVKPENIIIWGESLGGAVATSLAERNPCKSLVLLATFSSLPDIPWASLNMFEKMVITYIFLCIDPMETKHRIRNVTVPVIILHSPNDGFIPYDNALTLLASVSHENKHLMTIDGTHTSPKVSSNQIRELMNLMCCRDVDTSMTLTALNDVLDEIAKPTDYAPIIRDYNKRFTFMSKRLHDLPPLL